MSDTITSASIEKLDRQIKDHTGKLGVVIGGMFAATALFVTSDLSVVTDSSTPEVIGFLLSIIAYGSTLTFFGLTAADTAVRLMRCILKRHDLEKNQSNPAQPESSP